MDARDDWTEHSDQIASGEVIIPEDVLEALDFWSGVLSRELGGKVLDVGCGVGMFSYLFSSFDYTGIDQTPSMLKTARERNPDLRLIRGNARSLPFPDAQFDLVFTRAVVQHNRGQDKLDVIDEITRVVRPKGYYLFSEADYLTKGVQNLDDIIEILPGFKLVDVQAGGVVHLFCRNES